MSRTSNCFDVESKRSPLCEKQPVLVYGVLCLNERAHLIFYVYYTHHQGPTNFN